MDKKYWDIIVDIAKIIAAIGSVIVIILALWGDWIRNVLSVGPKLIIEPHNLRGDLTQRGNGTKTIYYHLKIRNLHKWITAKSVRVVCVRLQKEIANGTFEDDNIIIYPQFCNAPSELSILQPSVRDIQIIDFGYLDECENTLKLAFYVTPNNFKGIEKNVRARVSLRIFADNFSTNQDFIYEVFWDGVWTGNLDEMINHLKIKQVT